MRRRTNRPMGIRKRGSIFEPDLTQRFNAISKADWADIFADLYRETCGEELAPIETMMLEAERRLAIVKRYRS